ncbi:MAG TPA: S-methyl-5-thioribose-1-phosphate isomerase [bacterium]|jgi:methylthioribose-1-phosphate isomerase
MREQIQALRWDGTELLILDQRKLPGREVWIRARTVETVAKAIETLAVRGAPVIGIAAAYGVALAGLAKHATPDRIRAAIARLAKTRPTGYNLFHALGEMAAVVDRNGGDLLGHLIRKAIQIHRSDTRACLSMARNGFEVMGADEHVLTYCNTGALATGGIGTALGVIKYGHTHGKVKDVYACETRPVGQGARLTVWECSKAGLPVTLLCDNMVAALMLAGRVTRVFVGADRIARNGDTSNKIGTAMVATIAHANRIPFHVVAPVTTFDLSLRSGKDIPIEQRNRNEILSATVGLNRVPGVEVWNPAFDVTPHKYVTSFITDAGVVRPPFTF